MDEDDLRIAARIYDSYGSSKIAREVLKNFKDKRRRREIFIHKVILSSSKEGPIKMFANIFELKYYSTNMGFSLPIKCSKMRIIMSQILPFLKDKQKILSYNLCLEFTELNKVWRKENSPRDKTLRSRFLTKILKASKRPKKDAKAENLTHQPRLTISDNSWSYV